ncbi:MAG TPA: arylsulfatase [Planctomycetota bacterium]|nr:arylsulfatase [Planctomycetota bacterium]
MRSVWPALLAVQAACGSVPGEPRAERPNIVILLADDLGFSDIGGYGGEIETPHLDRLAAEGLRFTQFYNTARCCPTRASLLTGLYPHRAGVGHMVEDRGCPGYRGFLNERCVTIAEVLRAAGYRTLMAGKWHVGGARPHWPVDRGFDRYYGLIDGGSNYFKLDRGRTMALDGERVSPPAGEPFYMTDAFTDRALEFLDEAGRAGKPFFLYVAFTAPHWPLHAPPEDIAKYRGRYRAGWDEIRRRRHRKMIELGIVDARWPLSPRDPRAPAWEDVRDPEDRDLRMAVYAAQVDRMDRNIGRLLGRLEQMGAARNTLVFFLSDNGGCAEEIRRPEDPAAPIGTAGSFASYGLPWANVSNTPFRLYKHWVHEGGIATPLIVRWPAGIRTSGLVHEPGHVIDLLPTCLEAAGAEYPRRFEGREIEPAAGRSLRPLFEGKSLGERPLFWEHEGHRAVRKGRWKLVATHKGAWELYDLEADRTEAVNRASRHPEIVGELAALWDAWARESGVLPWEDVARAKPR